MTDDPASDRFAELARQPDGILDLEEGAILIAAPEYPALRVEGVRAEFDKLGEAALVQMETSQGDPVDALNRFLFQEQRFAAAEDYYDPRNSYMNEVLARRRGIPITLSLVYMAVGRRVGLDPRGVSFPGHFLVRLAGPEDHIVDPFHGRTLTRTECEARLAGVLGSDAVFDPAVHLRDATPREILVRMLSNLQRIFAEQGDAERLLSCCDRIVMLTPDDPNALLARAQVYEGMGWLAPAIADLGTTLEKIPDGNAAKKLRARRDALRARRGPLH